MSERLFLMRQQNGRCFYCGRRMRAHTHDGDPRLATEDHFVPRAIGGEDKTINKVGACLECNQRKADSIYVRKPKARPQKVAKATDAAIQAARASRKAAERRRLGVRP